MDKTKRTLGSRRTAFKRGIIDAKQSASSTDSNHCKTVLDSETISTQGILQHKQNGTCLPITPKRESLGKEVKIESPALASPLQSPGCQALFPKSFGSPEIEVSWDWGCSQQPREMLPPRSKKKLKTHQPVPVVVPNGIYGPRLQEIQMSEEENQERLAFYKNILSRSLKHDDPAGSKLNNSLGNEAGSFFNPTNCTTPKRIDQEERNGEDQVHSFFDDSANDLIFECSQAVEEKIANGEIDVERGVNVSIPKLKPPLNTSSEHEHINKKICYGKTKLNLFPEISRSNKSNSISPRRNECNDVNSTQSKRFNCHANLKPTKLIESLCKENDNNTSTQSMKKGDILNKRLNNQNLHCSVSLNNNFAKNPVTSGHASNHSVHNIEVNCCSKQDQVPLSISARTIDNDRLENSDLKNKDVLNIQLTVNNNKLGSISHTVGKLPDVKSLLEDEFDNELSSMDFDSLCHNSQISRSHNLKTTGKSSICSQVFNICSQEEIEKKRLAALNRLKTKKNGRLV